MMTQNTNLIGLFIILLLEAQQQAFKGQSSELGRALLMILFLVRHD